MTNNSSRTFDKLTSSVRAAAPRGKSAVMVVRIVSMIAIVLGYYFIGAMVGLILVPGTAFFLRDQFSYSMLTSGTGATVWMVASASVAALIVAGALSVMKAMWAWRKRLVARSMSDKESR